MVCTNRVSYRIFHQEGKLLHLLIISTDKLRFACLLENSYQMFVNRFMPFNCSC